MANHHFNTANQTFRQLFGNGLTYRIPPFQRDYSWAEDEWDDLWQDMMALFDDKNEESSHYMGYLVLQSLNNKQFDVIDGQQRLTTISILILAALKHLSDLVDKGIDADRNRRRKENLRASYIGYVDPVSLVARSKLELNRHNNRFYQTYLVPLEKIPQRNLNRSEHLLRKSFNWFKERIKCYAGDKGEVVAGFIDSLVDRLFFTVMSVTDELNAFTVFETLNARGVRLSATDLLKNYLFSVIDSKERHAWEMRALEERWERIVGTLGGESFPAFLRVYWNSRNKIVRKSDLFKTIRKHIKTREQAFELVRSLDHASTVYAALKNPSDSLWRVDERNALQHLHMFNVSQPMALLLQVYEKFADEHPDWFLKILKSIDVVSFRYNVVCNKQTHDQERLYNSISLNVFTERFSHWSDVVSALKDVYPEDEEFKSTFKEKEFRTTCSRNKKIVRYILFELEKSVAARDYDFESSRYTIEHILPENPNEQWDSFQDENIDRFIYRLGNMTLLEASLNRKIGNSVYQKKRQAYAGSTFQLTRAIAKNYHEWNEAKVESRQHQMANKAVSLWSIDFT